MSGDTVAGRALQGVTRALAVLGLLCTAGGAVAQSTPPVGAQARGHLPPLPSPAGKPQRWSESNRGTPLDLGRSRLIYAEDFNRPLSLDGPTLWAKQHANYGRAKFDPAGGQSYAFRDGYLALTAYRSGDDIRGGNVQSVSIDQAARGAPVDPGRNGFTCAGCYWEARLRLPVAEGTWAAFWLLTRDDPLRRGHSELDVLEYYGIRDKNGHHHATHLWPRRPDQRGVGGYSKVPALSDGQWHDYGVDLRRRGPRGQPQVAVIYVDRQEVARATLPANFFEEPFYYLVSLTINGKEKSVTLPQTLLADYVRVWR
jgi:hypothetical protein